MTTRFHAHVLLTRFNCPLDERRRGLDADWLDHRLDVFERCTAPSVRAQTSDDFAWVVFADARTAAGARDRLERCVTGSDGVLVWVDEPLARVHVRAAVSDLVGPSQGAVLTSRLDSDDAIGPELLQRVRETASGIGTGLGGPIGINVALGAQVSDAGCFLTASLSSPFVSLLEPNTASAYTALGVRHHELIARGRVRQVWPRRPQWLQTVHARNISTDAAGVPVPASAVRRWFPAADVAAGTASGRAAVKATTSLVTRRLGPDVVRRVRAVLP